jgi:hypothetical protein
MFAKKFPRCVGIAVVALGLATAGVSFANPDWASDLGLDFWNVPTFKQKLARDKQLRIELDRIDEKVLKRIAIKETVVTDLVAGKIDLLEAAAEFRAVNLTGKYTPATVRLLFPAPTEDESICLHLLCHVDAFAQSNQKARAVAVRLRAELDRHIAAGTLKLPDVVMSNDDE